jgi:hypothetical protein
MKINLEYHIKIHTLWDTSEPYRSFTIATLLEEDPHYDTYIDILEQFKPIRIASVIYGRKT